MSEVAEVVVTPADAEKAVQKAFGAAMKAAAVMGVKPVKCVSGWMKTDDFIALRGFGMNRDVSKRITADKNSHLKGSLVSMQQMKVAIIITNDSNSADFYNAELPAMKIDGHSRCAAWLSGQLEKPQNVIVEFFFDLTDEEIITEYKVFTDSKAQATQAEKNQIDKKLNHFEPSSPFVQASWADAFKKLEGLTYDEGLKEYGKLLLEVVDKWNVKPERGNATTKRHSTGVKMAILRTYSSTEGELTNWETFWLDFFADVSEIKQCAQLRIKVKGISTHSPTAVKDACEDAFRAYEKAQAKKSA